MSYPPAASADRADLPRHGRTDYAGAVYGSLLAASVVATAGTLGSYPGLKLIVLLLVTGLVFWVTHVYAHLSGERLVGQPWSWHETRRVAVHEWAIVEAAVLPAAAVALAAVAGLDEATAAWLAIGVAVAQQVAWACLGAARAGATRRQMIVEGAVNLLLGLIIVGTKAALKH